MLSEFGVSESSPDRLVRAVSKLLRRRVFYTVGPAESRAWAIAEGETAKQAAGRIHSDISDTFVAAEVTPCASWGRVPFRLEGPAYEVQDGDVIVFRHGRR